MRRLRYQVACSLDGSIAGPDDEFDWITPEPTFEFEALHAQFDTLLMGRRTWEIVRASGESFRGKQVIVASRGCPIPAFALRALPPYRTLGRIDPRTLLRMESRIDSL